MRSSQYTRHEELTLSEAQAITETVEDPLTGMEPRLLPLSGRTPARPNHEHRLQDCLRARREARWPAETRRLLLHDSCRSAVEAASFCLEVL
jgi:hypothetical protein